MKEHVVVVYLRHEDGIQIHGQYAPMSKDIYRFNEDSGYYTRQSDGKVFEEFKACSHDPYLMELVAR